MLPNHITKTNNCTYMHAVCIASAEVLASSCLCICWLRLLQTVRVYQANGRAPCTLYSSISGLLNLGREMMSRRLCRDNVQKIIGCRPANAWSSCKLLGKAWYRVLLWGAVSSSEAMVVLAVSLLVKVMTSAVHHNEPGHYSGWSVSSLNSLLHWSID